MVVPKNLLFLLVIAKWFARGPAKSLPIITVQYLVAFRQTDRQTLGLVEVDEKGEAKVLVLDADGKSTKGTVEELVKEIKGDNRYKKLVKGVVPGSGTIGDPQLPNLKQEPQLPIRQQRPSVLSERTDAKDMVKFLEARIANRRG